MQNPEPEGTPNRVSSPDHINPLSLIAMDEGSGNRIPLWIKLLYTAFTAVLVPVYWREYGPTNYLYFCDIALFLTLVGVWLESPLLLGIPAVGIFLPQMAWCVDFAAVLIGALVSTDSGFFPIGMTN